MSITRAVASAAVTAVFMAAIYWGTSSTMSLLLLPALAGFSALLVDLAKEITTGRGTRYDFGLVQYAAIALWGVGGLVGLAVVALR